jgi:hypothetical protein
MYWVSLTYAMQAASSPSRCTWGLRMVVFTALQFLPNTGTGTYTQKISSHHVYTHVTSNGKTHSLFTYIYTFIETKLFFNLQQLSAAKAKENFVLKLEPNTK